MNRLLLYKLTVIILTIIIPTFLLQKVHADTCPITKAVRAHVDTYTCTYLYTYTCV